MKILWMLSIVFCWLSPAVLFAAADPAGTQPVGELLYNGIRLPAAWPPRPATLTREPMPIPYLDSPAAVIPIDVGRQLFVDDFLIERATLHRTFHAARYIEGNPVLTPDKPWETLDEDGKAIAPWSAANCIAVRGDGTKLAVSWKDSRDLAKVAGRPIRFAFHFEPGKGDCHFYSFWVSRDPSGSSGGFVASGGPEFGGPIDLGTRQ